jgi:hypothetical protein
MRGTKSSLRDAFFAKHHLNQHNSVSIKTMTSQSIPAQTQASYDFDDNSFRTQSQRAADDPTGVPVFPAEEAGHNFMPFNIEYRDFQIKSLPQSPLELFQLFVPISLVQSWIEYTNSWVTHLIQNGVIDNWNTPISQHSRILQWEGISTATAYIWLGIMIYQGIHRDSSIKDHWHSPSPGDQCPLHPIIKFMPLRKFQLITRYFRTFDNTEIDMSV